MNNDDTNYIYDFLEEVDYIVIPEEFIAAVYIREYSGDEYIIPLDQLDEILESGEFDEDEIEVIEPKINLPMVKKRIDEISTNILNKVFCS